MQFEDLIVLVPCHSLEDFPTELPEAAAEGVLNAWVVPWHPVLLANAGVLPRWHRADDPPEMIARRLVMLAPHCQDRVPSGWADKARREGATVISGLTDRKEMLAAALAPLGGAGDIDPDLAADFMALGFCYLQMELLTRQMRHYSNLDEVHLQREGIAAAKAAVAHDSATARTRLRACFEVLMEARERFYPVDCYLIDLCLLIPQLADQHLGESLANLKPMNVMLSAHDLEEMQRDKPNAIAELREAWERASAAVVGGEWKEAPLPLMPLESILWQFAHGQETTRRLLGRQPVIWGRRRFGLFPQLPQILQKFGYEGALHVALDDGLYPDMEHSKVRWEGTNGTVMDAISRIPLAADSASSYLRLPNRMSDSMDNDHVAAVVFARWPEVKAPWFDDLRRMQNYSPVLGRWIALEDYFRHTDSTGRMSGYDINDYLTPFLVQSVARREDDPVSRYVNHFRRRQTYDTAAWMRGLRAALMQQPVAAALDSDLETLVEQAAPDADAAAILVADQKLAEFFSQAGRDLADLITHGGAANPGCLVINTLSTPRTASVPLFELESPPAVGGPVKFVQWEGARKYATVELPGSGFLWLSGTSPAAASPAPRRSKEPPMAEENQLRNEFFELYLNPQTGGISQLKEYGRRPNRLSHQLALRFPKERKIPQEHEGFEVSSYYSQMVARTSEVVCAGPSMGEIRNTGDIVDQVKGQPIARFEQTFRIWRGRPILEIDIQLEILQELDGDPWTNYYAARFAWNDPAAVLTRSVVMGAQGIKDQRFESPHFLEIATAEERTTILFHGQPFHRKTNDRMIDTLLVTAGERQRQFRFTIAIDQSYPMQAALDALTPPVVVATPNGPPRSGSSGWFFHLSAKNVQITRILGLLGQPPEQTATWERHDQPAAPTGPGCAVRLLETEGRPVRTQLRAFRTPVRARQRDFQGRTLSELTIEGDAVIVDLTPYEIADIELLFA